MPLRVRVCILVLTLPLLVCGVLDVDSWPFSNFPMYSAPLRLGMATRYGLYRIEPDGRSREIRSREWLWPLNRQRLQPFVRQRLKQPEQLRALLADYARRWPLGAGQRLELREQRVRLFQQDDRLHSQLFSSQVISEVGGP